MKDRVDEVLKPVDRVLDICMKHRNNLKFLNYAVYVQSLLIIWLILAVTMRWFA